MNDLVFLKSVLLVFVIFMSCHTQYLYGQTKISLPNDIYLSLYSEPKEELANRYQRIQKYNYENLNTPSKDIYDFIRTVYNLYNEKDSSTYFFNKMINRSRRRVCRILVGAEKNHKVRLKKQEINPEYNWFLYDLPDIDGGEILKECKSYLDSIKATPLKKEKKMSGVIELISKRDHKYRGDANIDWTAQNKLDSINRVSIDSLYQVSGSLRNYSKDELFVFSLVLHHSDDCEWNMKWIEILFLEKKKNKIYGVSLLQEAIKRMFKTGEGFCYNRDSLKSKLFIEKLKIEYPELAKIYLNGI